MAAITIDLPDAIIKELEVVPGEISRRVLEAVAIEGYRSERLSRGEVRQLLGLSWQETEDFLARHGLPYHYTIEDLNEDRKNLDIPVRADPWRSLIESLDLFSEDFMESRAQPTSQHREAMFE